MLTVTMVKSTDNTAMGLCPVASQVAKGDHNLNNVEIKRVQKNHCHLKSCFLYGNIFVCSLNFVSVIQLPCIRGEIGWLSYTGDSNQAKIFQI